MKNKSLLLCAFVLATGLVFLVNYSKSDASYHYNHPDGWLGGESSMSWGWPMTVYSSTENITVPRPDETKVVTINYPAAIANITAILAITWLFYATYTSIVENKS